MKTQEFLSLLESFREKDLQFQYRPNEWVGANYHITEVKHIQINAVDCGAREDSWNETVIQLWESPSEIGKTDFMKARKALGILKKVARLKAFDLTSEVKFEYGNPTFHTAQLFINDYEISEKSLKIHLAVEQTDCKAKELCGVPDPSKNQESEKLMASEEACCTPGGGCC
jgi:hypothetical protein